MNNISLEGRVAIVTGSGKGIGRSHALALAARGARVVVNDIARDDADSVAREISAAGGTVVTSYDSVATPDGGRRIAELACERFGTVDILINNAGTIRPNFFHNMTDDDIQNALDVNLWGSFSVTKTVWPIMQEKRYGRIVMTSSGSGLLAHGGLANYAAVKAGVFGLMKSLASEGSECGINVTAILPGAATTMGQEFPQTAEFLHKYFGEIHGGELDGRADPELAAHLVLYLVSDECDINGEAFSAVGGRYARIFVGVADGWLPADVSSVSPEAIRDHIGEIRDLTHFSVPEYGPDEFVDLRNRLRVLNAS